MGSGAREAGDEAWWSCIALWSRMAHHDAVTPAGLESFLVIACVVPRVFNRHEDLIIHQSVRSFGCLEHAGDLFLFINILVPVGVRSNGRKLGDLSNTTTPVPPEKPFALASYAVCLI